MENLAMSSTSNESQRIQAAARLRQVIAAEDYEGVATALADYRRQVEASLASCPPGSRPPVELAREADELMHWALQVVRSARTRARDQLDQAAAVLGYCHPAPPVPTWKIDG
jgi:hypothetical protein